MGFESINMLPESSVWIFFPWLCHKYLPFLPPPLPLKINVHCTCMEFISKTATWLTTLYGWLQYLILVFSCRLPTTPPPQYLPRHHPVVSHTAVVAPAYCFPFCWLDWVAEIAAAASCGKLGILHRIVMPVEYIRKRIKSLHCVLSGGWFELQTFHISAIFNGVNEIVFSLYLGP